VTDAESGSPPRQLVVGADLTLESDQADVSITTTDGKLVVAVESVGGLRELYNLEESVTGSASELLPVGDELPDDSLFAFNTPADVTLHGHTIAHYNPEGSAGLLGRLTGVAGVEVKPAGVLRALAAEALG
jgi:hypothetical protein